MRGILRRIAIHGGLTALMLGIIGFMLAELASIWLAGSPGVRMTNGDPVEGTDANGEVANALRSRLPILLALWGFAFVAVGELVLQAIRRRRKVAARPVAQPDEAERLLEELLLQVESQKPLTPDAAVEREATSEGNPVTVAPLTETKV